MLAFADLLGTLRLIGNLAGPDHHSSEILGREVFDPAASRDASTPQHRHLLGESHYFSELVSDEQNGKIARETHLMQQAQDLIRLRWGQHRSRLIEDQYSALQVELLENLDFLFLTGRQGAYLRPRIYRKRHIFHEV